MTRYTTKHFWRMKESEEGEWVRYDEVSSKIEYLLSKLEEANEYNKLTWLAYSKEYRSADHLETRVRALYIVLMVTYGAIVAKLIVWSLGL